MSQPAFLLGFNHGFKAGMEKTAVNPVATPGGFLPRAAEWTGGKLIDFLNWVYEGAGTKLERGGKFKRELESVTRKPIREKMKARGAGVFSSPTPAEVEEAVGEAMAGPSGEALESLRQKRIRTLGGLGLGLGGGLAYKGYNAPSEK